jgi:tRNA A37 methylthiotransferase MiaB
MFRLIEEGCGILSCFRENTAGKVHELLENGWDMLPQNVQEMATRAGNMATMAGTVGELAVGFTHSRVMDVMSQALPQLFPSEASDPDDNVEIIDGPKIVVWLVHPTRYRKDGTPCKWKKQILPSNAIGQLHALLPKSIRDGEDREIPVECHILEDTVQPFNLKRIGGSMQSEDAQGIVMFCGVQTNQWPRGLDLASLCRQKEIPVAMGGYHVRAELPLTSAQAQELGISLAIGEAEATYQNQRNMLETILRDVADGHLQAEYRQSENPDISRESLSDVMPEYQEMMFNPTMATLETSRGCPMPCSFCTIRTIGGREVRARNPGQMKDWLQKVYLENGIRSIFITDDNFARNDQRFEVLQMLEELRNEGSPIDVMIQVDTMAAKGNEGRRFVEACGRAGVYGVFLGIESLDPMTLKAMKKSQNKPEKYREVTDAWHGINAIAQCGFIIGNEADTIGVGKRSAQTLIDMGIDIASSFILTPLPGSIDYHKLHERGLVTCKDFNSYDSHSEACIQFPGGLTREQILAETTAFYDEFYSLRHLPGLAGRLSGHSLQVATRQWLWYKLAASRGDHPMFSGFGAVKPDYVRSQFPDRTPENVSDLAPSQNGPGSAARENAKTQQPAKRLALVDEAGVAQTLVGE